MGLISEIRQRKIGNTILGEQPCLCCGKERPQRGGFCHDSVGLLICSSCIMRDDLYPIGMALGDAILDLYKNQFCGEREGLYPSRIVDDILQRLEKTIYRTLAVGWFNHNRNKYGTGLRND